MDPTVAAAAVTGAAGLAAVLVTHVVNRRHTRAAIGALTAERDQAHAQADAAQAQASQAISAAATAMLTPLTEQVTRLTGQVATLTAENAALRVEVEELRPLRGEVAEMRIRLARHERTEDRLLAARERTEL